MSEDVDHGRERKWFSREFRERAVVWCLSRSASMGRSGRRSVRWRRRSGWLRRRCGSGCVSEVDAGSRAGVPAEESVELKRLRRESAELRHFHLPNLQALEMRLVQRVDTGIPLWGFDIAARLRSEVTQRRSGRRPPR